MDKFFLPEDAVDYFRQAVAKGAEAAERMARTFRRLSQGVPQRSRRTRAVHQRQTARKLGCRSAQMEAGRQAHRHARRRRRSAERARQEHPQHHRRLGRPEPLHQHRAQRCMGDFQPPEIRRPGHAGAVGGVWGYAGRNVAFGVREHAMGAAVNGMAAHGGVLPFSATFLVFSDYMKPSIRLGALEQAEGLLRLHARQHWRRRRRPHARTRRTDSPACAPFPA